MKNLLFTAVAVLMAVFSFSQKTFFVRPVSAPTDTLWMPESQVQFITQNATGSALEYTNKNGDYAAVNILERTDDTVQVNATVVITFAGASGSIDSITINGVEIMGDTVGFTTNIGTTVGLVEDSIDNTTTDPEYTAANTSAVLTITASNGAKGDTANGYDVVVYTRTITASLSSGQMSGGFTRVRNIVTMTDHIINVSGGVKAVNSGNILSLYDNPDGGCYVKTIFPNKNVRTATESCSTISSNTR